MIMPDTAPLLHKHAQELRDTWQCRCLVEAKGKLGAVMLSVLMHSYTTAMPILLRVAFPGFRDINPPFFCSGATIVKTGKVVADMIDRFQMKHTNVPVFDSEADLIKQLRNLADRLKLNDRERVDLTEAVKRWVVADLRVNHLGQAAVA